MCPKQWVLFKLTSKRFRKISRKPTKNPFERERTLATKPPASFLVNPSERIFNRWPGFSEKTLPYPSYFLFNSILIFFSSSFYQYKPFCGNLFWIIVCTWQMDTLRNFTRKKINTREIYFSLFASNRSSFIVVSDISFPLYYIICIGYSTLTFYTSILVIEFTKKEIAHQ